MDNFLKKRNICGYWQMTAEEIVYRRYWDLIKEVLESTYSDSISVIIFGDICCKYITQLMGIHYIYTYLVNARRSILLAGTQDDVAGNRTLYKISELEKKMICCGIPGKTVRDIMTLFGFYPITSGSLLTTGGIGYMSIEEGTNKFIVS